MHFYLHSPRPEAKVQAWREMAEAVAADGVAGGAAGAARWCSQAFQP